MRVTATIALCLLAEMSVFGSLSAAEPPLPTDAELRQILIDRVDVQRQSLGMVIGLVTPNRRRIVSYGRLDTDRPGAPDGRTIFDIASVTKVFTALVLADMARRGEVSLDDPVNKYLPEGVHMPSRNGRAITLIDLATHTSSLPTWPSDLSPLATEAIADYSPAQLYDSLAGYALTRDIGSRWEYSNVGMALLALALSRRMSIRERRARRYRPYQVLRDRHAGRSRLTRSDAVVTRAAGVPKGMPPVAPGAAC